MELNNLFADKHEYFSFSTHQQRKEFWLGRLVQAKVSIKINLFDEIKPETIGLVTGVGNYHDGLAYLLDIRWMDGTICPCYQHDVFSHTTGGKHAAKTQP